MNDILACGYFPSLSRKKANKTWNALSVTKPLLKTLQQTLPSLLHSEKRYNHPQEITFHLADDHRFTHEIAY